MITRSVKNEIQLAWKGSCSFQRCVIAKEQRRYRKNLISWEQMKPKFISNIQSPSSPPPATTVLPVVGKAPASRQSAGAMSSDPENLKEKFGLWRGLWMRRGQRAGRADYLQWLLGSEPRQSKPSMSSDFPCARSRARRAPSGGELLFHQEARMCLPSLLLIPWHKWQ